jgi:hypothetical protein
MEIYLPLDRQQTNTRQSILYVCLWEELVFLHLSIALLLVQDVNYRFNTSI